MNQQQCEEIFKRFAQRDFQPTTELQYRNAYELLVAVILSAQATDRSVNRVTKNLFLYANSPQAMLDFGEERLKEAIRSIGLYRNKAKNIIHCSRQLIENFAGEVPRQRKDLQTLAGVGRKTANVVLNTLYGEATIAVDTHVFRVANRLGLVRANTVEKAEAQLMDVVPDIYVTRAHHWLILHGRYICKAKRSLCTQCFLNDLCDAIRLGQFMV